MTKIVDLRPDKKLINSKFEKYQFSADTIPVINKKELKTEILRLEPNSSQDSWLEAKLFAFHNHLFKNPYNSNCFFIDSIGGIWTYMFNGTLELIYTSNFINQNLTNCIYNPTIAFASENIFVVCNGGGTLEFLFECNGLVKNCTVPYKEPSVILDARFVEEISKIIIVLYSIAEDNGKRFSKLEVLFYNYEQDIKNQSHKINLIRNQILKVKGTVEHVYIEKTGCSCYVISQDHVQFDYDSVNAQKKKNKNLTEESSQVKIPKYCWSQNEDSITVYVKVPENYTEFIKTAKVETMPSNIYISVGDLTILAGQTPHRLESELTTWKQKGGTLEVELSKHENNLMWSELIKGDTGGEYLPNETLAAEIHSRLYHLCSEQQESNVQGQPAIGFNSEQLEECDLSGAENILQKINFEDQDVTHMAMLGSTNRVLFAEKRSSGQVICLRYDHDGCIWIIEETQNKDWDLKHIHTFPGFGYVEASKTNKKFCVSSPDGSYIAIVEHARHAFLYEKPEINEQVAKQRIIDYGNNDSPILGAVALNKDFLILTKTSLYQLQVY